MKLCHTGGDWRIRKTVDDSGDYPFPTYDIIACFEYGPEGIGTAYQNPYNARLFACSSRLLYALIENIGCNVCDTETCSKEECNEYKNRLLIEEATGKKIEEVLYND